MDFITSTIVPYLFKGGLLSLATYFLGDVRRFVKSAMWQSLIQAIVLGFILFLLDRFMPPREEPVANTGLGLGTVPTTTTMTSGDGIFGNQGLMGNQTQGLNPQNLLNNLYNLITPKRQVGGDCGCGVKTQMGGECGASGAVPVGYF